jgi:ABC-type glutathione transport system ATPase component
VVVLAGGQVVEEGEPQKVLTRPRHPATRELLQVEPAKRRAKR